jgi:Ca2+/Na+ antiporter
LGIIDGFNPCAMWSLMILLGFLITMENKARRWLIGGVFLAASGILYGGALLAYLFGFTQITYLLSGGVMPWLFRGVGTLAIIAALFSFYAFYKNKVECEIRNPDEKRKFHKKLSDLLKKEELLLILPGLILLAFSVNAVELLCSFAIPTAFVATIVQMDLSLTAQLTAVAIYDLAYMLDDLIVFLIAMFTLSFAMISPKIVRISHLIGGIILLILGYLLLFHPSVLSLISKGIN